MNEVEFQKGLVNMTAKAYFDELQDSEMTLAQKRRVALRIQGIGAELMEMIDIEALKGTS